jgi:hypothetical protein
MAPRPEFGKRPSGEGFRPSFSTARPGLLRHDGLQDAMQSARNSPLERALTQPPTVDVLSAELNQAVEALRNRVDVSRQQLMTRSLQRRRTAPAPAHVARFAAAAPAPDTSDVNLRLRNALESAHRNAGAVSVRQVGDGYVLEGTVASARDQRVIEWLLRLEPGIDRIENRLQIMPRENSD